MRNIEMFMSKKNRKLVHNQKPINMRAGNLKKELDIYIVAYYKATKLNVRDGQRPFEC